MPSHERIGRALNSSNLRSKSFHGDVDVVAALAFASALGSSLQSLRSAGNDSELKQSIELLSHALVRGLRHKKIGINRGTAVVVAKQALLEWMIQICKLCNGSGKVLADYSGKPPALKGSGLNSCLHCEGTGLFHATWGWRQQMLGLIPQDQSRSSSWYEKRIDLAKSIAQEAYVSAKRKVSAQLEET